jgi:hypothetical protein
MTIGTGAWGELAWGQEVAAAAPPPPPPTPGAAAVWAYELLPGVTAGDMLTAIYEMMMEVEPGFDQARVLRIIAASVAGKTSGGPAGFIARNLGDTTNMIAGTSDASGNRSDAIYGA